MGMQALFYKSVDLVCLNIYYVLYEKLFNTKCKYLNYLNILNHRFPSFNAIFVRFKENL